MSRLLAGVPPGTSGSPTRMIEGYGARRCLRGNSWCSARAGRFRDDTGMVLNLTRTTASAEVLRNQCSRALGPGPPYVGFYTSRRKKLAGAEQPPTRLCTARCPTRHPVLSRHLRRTRHTPRGLHQPFCCEPLSKLQRAVTSPPCPEALGPVHVSHGQMFTTRVSAPLILAVTPNPKRGPPSGNSIVLVAALAMCRLGSIGRIVWVIRPPLPHPFSLCEFDWATWAQVITQHAARVPPCRVLAFSP